MNHCITCGQRVRRGRSSNAGGTQIRCLICQVKRSMSTFHYVSPAMRRWQRKKESQ